MNLSELNKDSASKINVEVVEPDDEFEDDSDETEQDFTHALSLLEDCVVLLELLITDEDSTKWPKNITGYLHREITKTT